MKKKHFLTVKDFSTKEILELLELSEKFKNLKKQGVTHEQLKGKTIAMVFQKPSNRTRVSFEVGINDLGGHAINIRPAEIELGQREKVSDVARVLSRYVDLVMLRVLRHTDLAEFAEYSSVPVINGLSDLHHPCQAIADVYTIKEHFKTLSGLTLCYVGDGNNVCSSLIEICNLLDIRIIVSCPKGFDPILNKNQHEYEIIRFPYEAVTAADIVYTDVWTSMGQENETLKRLRAFEGYTITPELMQHAKPDAIFMHCLPAHRGEEVSDEIMDSEICLAFDQAENRLHTQKALMCYLMDAVL